MTQGQAAHSSAFEPLAALGLPRRFDFDELLAAVEAYRGRTIDIRSVPSLNNDQLTGLWLSLPQKELILHAETRSPLHREQIVLHELAHMILGHDLVTDDHTGPDLLFPDLSPDLVRKALTRCDKRDRIESDAEALADRLAATIARARRVRAREPRNFGSIFG